jgi:hypothetical protein
MAGKTVTDCGRLPRSGNINQNILSNMGERNKARQTATEFVADSATVYGGKGIIGNSRFGTDVMVSLRRQDGAIVDIFMDRGLAEGLAMGIGRALIEAGVPEQPRR